MDARRRDLSPFSSVAANRFVAIALAFAGCGRIGFDSLAPSVDAADASTDGVVSASPCSSAHAFCDDFDRSGGLGPWNALVTGTGSLDVVAQGRISPGALRMSLPSQPSGEGPALVATISGTGIDETRVAFDVRFDQIEADGEVDLLHFRWPPIPPCTAFGMYFVKTTSNTMALQETYQDCFGVQYHDVGAVDANWHHYELFVQYSTQKIRVLRDGVEMLSTQSVMPLPIAQHSMNLGGPFVVTPLSTPWTISFDDVVVDFR